MASDETIIEIEDVFVDREDALQYLENELRKRKNRKKEKAIRITQAPGTGKTRLLQEFIKKMEKEGKAVGIYINSPEIEDWITSSPANLEGILWRAVFLPMAEEVMDVDQLDIIDVKGLLKRYNLNDYTPYLKFNIILEEQSTYDDILVTFCSRIPNAIRRPIIIVFDEIQATIGRMTDRFQNEKGQGLFRNIIDLIAKLIKRKNVLVILSGTNYKIMHFLEHLGSPLLEKTNEYKIDPLESKYVGEFYDRIFGAPKNDTERKLRDWLIENSNGVPRTMVWMAETLEDLGGIKWANEIGIEQAIKKLDEMILEQVISNMRKVYNDLVQFANGREMLEWLIYRNMLDHQIPQVEFKYISLTEAKNKNLCTIDDLINKGVIHVVDNSVEIRNIYYEKALRDILGVENTTFKTILDMSNINESELSGLLTWQRSMLGAYLEMAVALGLYNLSKKNGIVNLNQFFDMPTDKDIKMQINKIVRVPSIDFIIDKHELNVLYASPERGPDLALFTKDNVILIECKNWQRPFTEREFDEIRKMFNAYREKLGENTIKVLITTKGYEPYTKNTDIHVISDENLKKLVGKQVFRLFESVRERARSVRPIAINVE